MVIDWFMTLPLKVVECCVFWNLMAWRILSWLVRFRSVPESSLTKLVNMSGFVLIPTCERVFSMCLIEQLIDNIYTYVYIHCMIHYDSKKKIYHKNKLTVCKTKTTYTFLDSPPIWPYILPILMWFIFMRQAAEIRAKEVKAFEASKAELDSSLKAWSYTLMLVIQIGKWTWNPNMKRLERWFFLWIGVIFGFHVNFAGCLFKISFINFFEHRQCTGLWVNGFNS